MTSGNVERSPTSSPSPLVSLLLTTERTYVFIGKHQTLQSGNPRSELALKYPIELSSRSTTVHVGGRLHWSLLANAIW